MASALFIRSRVGERQGHLDFIVFQTELAIMGFDIL